MNHHYTTKYIDNGYGIPEAIEVRPSKCQRWETKEGAIIPTWDVKSDPYELAEQLKANKYKNVNSKRRNASRLMNEADKELEDIYKINEFIAELEHHADSDVALQKS